MVSNTAVNCYNQAEVKLRTEIGQKGKKTVEHKYSVKANKQKYNSLFK